MTPREKLLKLRTSGFRPLRPGRIHLRCQSCGRKLSNTPRYNPDPPKAFLLEALCSKCSPGCKEDFGGYYDSKGRDLCSYCGRHRCERASGNWRCTEALMREAAGGDDEG